MLGPGLPMRGLLREAQSASLRWLLSLNTLDQRSLSLRMKASNSAGELATGVMPAFSSRSAMTGSA